MCTDGERKRRSASRECRARNVDLQALHLLGWVDAAGWHQVVDIVVVVAIVVVTVDVVVVVANKANTGSLSSSSPAPPPVVIANAQTDNPVRVAVAAAVNGANTANQQSRQGRAGREQTRGRNDGRLASWDHDSTVIGEVTGTQVRLILCTRP